MFLNLWYKSGYVLKNSVYANGQKISCTPPEPTWIPGNRINFKDHQFDSDEITAHEFRLNWENDECAQIEELYFYYISPFMFL